MASSRSLRAGLAAAALIVAGAAAPAQSGTDTFNLSLSGVHLGTVTLRVEQSGAEYKAASKIAPSMLVGAMTSYAFDGRATGFVDAAGNVSPVSFKADSSSPRAKRRTEIEWDGETPVRVSKAVSTPWAMSGDCSSIESMTPQVWPSKPNDSRS